ncbi:MAG TPA: glycosyltransferase family 39 protein, partial [Chloroflexia bacterium]|nr:glycosyltransferase family 39 protein [Chloroflexia bacterium]
MTRPAEIAVLGALVVFGLLVRLYGLTSYGIWWDEAYHVALVRLPTVGSMVDAVLSNPPSDPLYVLLLRPWTALLGTTDGSVRLLSVIFSTATVLATYALGRVVAGRRAALLGTGLLAVSPYAVELGQEAALYALAGLTTPVALAAGWHWRRSGRGALAYVLCGAVAIYSHYVVAAILALFAVLALTPTAGPARVGRSAWIIAHAAIATIWLPWLAALALHWTAASVPRATLPHRVAPDEVLGALVQFTSGSAALLQGRRPLEAAGLIAGAGLIALGWYAGAAAARRGLRLLLVISALIFLVPAMLSAVTGLWLFVPHFMLFLLPALCVILAAGAWAVVPGLLVATRAARPVVPALLGTALLLVWLGAQAWGLVLYHRYPPHGADGLRELAAQLHRERAAAEPVLIMPAVLTPP